MKQRGERKVTFRFIVLIAMMLLSLCSPAVALAAEEETGSELNVALEDLAPLGRDGLVGDIIGTAFVISPDDMYAVMPLSAEGTDCTIVPGKVCKYGSWSTNEFAVTTETGNYLGFCAQPNKSTPSGVYQVSKLNNDNIKVMLLCGAGGPFESAFCPNLFGNNDWYAYTHAVVGYLYSGDLTGLSSGSKQGVINIRNWTYGVLGLDANAPQLKNQTVVDAMDDYELYVAYNDRQDIVWIEPVPQITYGKIRINKTGALTGAPVAGAVYGIYADSACTKAVASVTTNDSGQALTGDLEAGKTYYVLEQSAPTGYTKNSAVHEVVLEEGTITLNTINEEWRGDIVITKMGTDGKKLAGAVFALHEWSKEKNAFVHVENFTDAGDGTYHSPMVYYMDDNEGRFLLMEVTAPRGYVTNGWEQEVTIHDGAGMSFSYAVENEPTRYAFIKTNEHGIPLEGSHFTLTDSTGAVIDSWETDEAGRHEMVGILRVGETYTLTETKVPCGYLPMDSITFTVENTGAWIEVEMKNESIHGSISIVKLNADSEYMEGVEFALYSDVPWDGGNQVEYEGKTFYEWQRKRTNGTGMVIFEDLDTIMGEEYLVIETDTNGMKLLSEAIYVGELPVYREDEPFPDYDGAWEERVDGYYLYDPEYIVINHRPFVLPMTGGTGFLNPAIALLGAAALIGLAGPALKKKIFNR